MGDIAAKLSSYNIFTNLIPGAVFAFIMKRLEIYDFGSLSAVVDVIMYYFLGVVISRIGSVILQPILKGIGFVEHGEYSKFIVAESKDPKIAVLLESSNFYRSLCSVLLTTLAAYGVKLAAGYFAWSLRSIEVCTVIFLLVLFLLSYRKQTMFIENRVQHHSQQP
ncbi:hypothetical protein FJ987_25825 [Mesorhizobium sp. CU2]|uniref:hypothetical protein n=1 Tax=unclassified Mesorhizobium TaxID=325217 RepID=UPI00112BD5F5|nr:MULTISPECIES: hypothetical protein [unclassified Mesorhizobium]TPN81044.1 hypothetical protein FJ988_19290 [Mesorhizobium sp. CU3]TPO05738.1 hypothetical protein FJ987_25825 [Mesorhizobium sp. CU2]